MYVYASMYNAINVCESMYVHIYLNTIDILQFSHTV